MDDIFRRVVVNKLKLIAYLSLSSRVSVVASISVELEEGRVGSVPKRQWQWMAGVPVEHVDFPLNFIIF